MNGTLSDVFHTKCSPCKGDPLSPYLFLFYTDIFSMMLSLGEDIKLFQGIRISRRCPSVSHLFLLTMLFYFSKLLLKGVKVLKR